VQVENGRPSASEFAASGNAIPSYVAAPNARIRDLVNRNDTRLRIFSGTANPALSQVTLFLERFVWFWTSGVGKLEFECGGRMCLDVGSETMKRN